MTLGVVGQRKPNINGVQIVTGQAVYASDIQLPGMLTARVLRSPYAHARILSIDASAARALPGVFAVVTADDTPHKPYLYLGPNHADRLPLAAEKVRFIGEEVAAVAAVDSETADHALSLIDVVYDPLPPVFAPPQAMKPDAPQLHAAKHQNIALHASRQFGDVDQQFADAAVVVEGIFETQANHHCCMEPFCVVAQWGDDDYLEIWASTQAPFYVQKELAHVLEIDPNQIRVHHVHVGGGFGARSKVAEPEAIAALLARQIRGRPVRLQLTREEEFETRTVTMPMQIRLRTAADSQGRLLARDFDLVSDNGAYNHCAPSVSAVAATMAYVMYRVPAARVEHRTVYTNKQTTAQMRGYGEPQAVFAIETQMDELGERLGIGPVEIRRRNLVQPGDTLINGWQITSCGVAECLEIVRDAIGWEEHITHRQRGHGIGFATMIHGTGGRYYEDGDYSSAIVRVGHDGRIVLEVGAVEIGQWSDTTLAQIAAETLGCHFEGIKVVSMDTERTPSDMGAFASKTVYLAGNAVRAAALDARGQLLRQAQSILGASLDELNIVDGYVVIDADPPERCMPFGDLVLDNPERIGRHIVGRGFWESQNTELFNRETGYGNTCGAYSFGAHAVEVAVDEITGEVTVLRVVAAHDVGRAINPTAVEGQVEGGTMQGLGFALWENHRWDDAGRVMANNFEKYGIPTIHEMPSIQTFVVETDDDTGPYGAKGVGEPAMVAPPAAVANAIYDAVGVRITSLPITAEKILYALREMRKNA